MAKDYTQRVLEIYRAGFWQPKARAVLGCRHVVDVKEEPLVGSLVRCDYCARAAEAFEAGQRAAGHSKLRMAKAELVHERHYVTRDHPAANGRTPLDGEHGVRFFFPLDDGSRLYVEVGRDGFASLCSVILSYMLDVQTHIADRTEDHR